ncbi:MAG: acetoacetate decarboxylase family protein [Acidimicrobiales bacterium]
MADGGRVEVLGQEVLLPVEVRTARSAAATFLVDHVVAARLMAHTGLAPKRLPGGRAACIIAAVNYIDNDLGPYNEVAFSIAVGATESAPAGAYIHQLPVDGEFTCAAGRGIWGFPKWLADFDMSIEDRRAHCRLSQDGELVLDLTIGTRVIPLPSKPMEMSAYAHLEGVTRRTPFTNGATAVQGGPFGAQLLLGDRHPMAIELRSLGLPKRAVFSSVIGNMAATFGTATELT